MKDRENSKWEMKEIAHQYKIENPNWSWKKCWGKARVIYRELNKLNRETFRDNDKFFRMNTPFSFYFDRDNEFADKYELRNG